MHFSLPVAVHVAITCQYLSLYCTQLSRTRVQRLLAIPTEKRITTTTYIWTSWIGARPHGLESTCISTVEASFNATAIHVGVSIEKWLQSLGIDWSDYHRLSHITTTIEKVATVKHCNLKAVWRRVSRSELISILLIRCGMPRLTSEPSPKTLDLKKYLGLRSRRWPSHLTSQVTCCDK